MMNIKCIKKRILRQEHICRHCMKKGMVVYYVHSLGSKSYITEYILTNKPHKNINFWFVSAKYLSSISDEYIVTEFSLRDAGIIKNNYNSHRSFIKKANADKYLRECLL